MYTTANKMIYCLKSEAKAACPMQKVSMLHFYKKNRTKVMSFTYLMAYNASLTGVAGG